MNESAASLSRTGDILVTLKIPLTGDWLLGLPSPSFGLIGFGEFLPLWLMYGSIVFASSASTYPLGGAGIGSAWLALKPTIKSVCHACHVCQECQRVIVFLTHQRNIMGM